MDDTNNCIKATQAELNQVNIQIRSVQLKRERTMNRIRELEFVLAETHNSREQLLRLQKPTCWAFEGELAPAGMRAHTDIN